MKTMLIAMVFAAGCGSAPVPGEDDAIESSGAGAKAQPAPPKPQPKPTPSPTPSPSSSSSGLPALPAKGGSSSGSGGGGSSSPTPPTACYTGTPAVDQSQLNGISMANLGPSDSVSQTLVVGKTGVLTGVEAALFYCNSTDSKATVRMEVRDSTGVPLAEAQISTTNLPHSCNALPLSSSKTGAGFFDLSTACVHVTAGEKLTLFIQVSGESAGACDLDANACTGGKLGATCFQDSDCASGDFRASLGQGGYSKGLADMDGTDYAVYDLAFKTFTR